MGWVVAGVVLLAGVVLVAAVMSLVGRLRPLERAVFRLNLRAEQVMRLQEKAVVVQERAEELRSRIDQAASPAHRPQS